MKLNTNKTKKLILLELNEINFDVVQAYVNRFPGKFAALEKLLKGPRVRTLSETRYEEIEPWIQWVSVHSGLTYEEHKVFRLGDIVGTQVPQLFEKVEQNGFRVGAISPMNAENRLKKPAYFVPDPWTETPASGSWLTRGLSNAVSQTVNDNSSAKITLRSAVFLVLGLVLFSQPRNYLTYIKLAATSLKAPWRKALFLDLFLHDFHMKLFRKKNPNFTTIFLNAGAHIQHHYLLSAKAIENKTVQPNPNWYINPEMDPFAEMLGVYDRIIHEYLAEAGAEAIIATGLSQKPYDRSKFYYRLKDHGNFLDLVGVKYKKVCPRMTRDFLVEFGTPQEAQEAKITLGELRVSADGLPLFGEIDSRGDSLFVTLTYPNQIDEDVRIRSNGKDIDLFSHVVFVAIKNGMHQSEGFAFFTPGLSACAPADRVHVKHLHNTALRYFGIESTAG